MYKVTERFLSIQGEGFWTGTPMAFLRLSQCPVGGAEGICKAWDGKEFVCDTGKTYSLQGGGSRPYVTKVEHHSYTEVNEQLEAEEIIEWVTKSGLKHLCVTGGEPLIYNLKPLISPLYLTHIETSGTQDIPLFLDRSLVWFTISPKWNCIRTWWRVADEVKVLVDKDTSISKIEDNIPIPEIKKLYFQPIEDENWKENTLNAIALARHFNAKVSVQVHKYLGLR